MLGGSIFVVVDDVVARSFAVENRERATCLYINVKRKELWNINKRM